jgi:MFS family permease
LSAGLRRSLASLAVPNYRRWFTGQLVSVTGNWMQIVAEMWLVLTLTGSAVAVGVTSALQFLPMLLAGAWGGLLADRLPKRRLLMVTQPLLALPALALFAITATGAVEPWMVFALVFVRGSVLAVDMPARHSFVIELVGAERVVNAVGLQSALVHASRIAGPASAGLLIATVGVEACFLLNALSFLATIVALRSLDPAGLRPPRPASREPGAVRAALLHVAADPALAIPLAMMALVGTLGFNFQVLLPLLATTTFGGGAGAYTGLAVAMGAGAVIGSLVSGARGKVGPGLLVGSAFAFGGFALAAASAPTLGLAAAALVPLGAAAVTFAAGVNSSLQLAADPSMRGRVMALYAIVFMGSTPIGAPIAGVLTAELGARAGLVMTAIAALTAGAGARIAYRRLPASAPSGALVALSATKAPSAGALAARADDADVEGRPAEGAHRPQPQRQVHLRPAGGGDVAEVEDRVRRPAEGPEQRRHVLLRRLVIARQEEVAGLRQRAGVDHHPGVDRVQGLDHAGVGKGGLDPLGEAVVVGDRQRRQVVAEGERVGDVDQHLAGEVVGAGGSECVHRRRSRGGVDHGLAELRRVRERPLARQLAGGLDERHRLLVARLARAHPHLVPQLDQLPRQRLPDHPRPEHAVPHI